MLPSVWANLGFSLKRKIEIKQLLTALCSLHPGNSVLLPLKASRTSDTYKRGGKFCKSGKKMGRKQQNSKQPFHSLPTRSFFDGTWECWLTGTEQCVVHWPPRSREGLVLQHVTVTPHTSGASWEEENPHFWGQNDSGEHSQRDALSSCPAGLEIPTTHLLQAWARTSSGYWELRQNVSGSSPFSFKGLTCWVLKLKFAFFGFSSFISLYIPPPPKSWQGRVWQ